MIGTDFRYHGMQLDAASGLYHVRARTYDARTGRFTSRDPAKGYPGQVESLHPYAFVANNPHIARDPTGATIQMVTVVIAVAVVLATIAIPAYGFTNYFIGEKTKRDVNALGLQKDAPGTVEGPNDAMYHCTTSCRIRKVFGNLDAIVLGIAQEFTRGSSAEERSMDFHNNCVGRRNALKDGECLNCCYESLVNGELYITNPLSFRSADIGALPADPEAGFPDGYVRRPRACRD